ncbi:Conserved hypothetical protein [Thermococcus gammatolerans EJ3]|uniref:Uncharacterized protein n=2 Tax=Thermococcus TaxID=2263 RepID=C5A6P0_THEGJ|nr:Conserved hypothetical protein [Thermococcus gammatolerans EJ3]
MMNTLAEIRHRVDELERFLRELIEVNLQLIEEAEPEEWERKAVKERKKDEFLNWDVIRNEL